MEISSSSEQGVRINISTYSEKTEAPMGKVARAMLDLLGQRYKTSPYERKVLELGVDSGSMIGELETLLRTEKCNGINIKEKLERDEKIRRHALAGDPLALPIQAGSVDIVVSKYLFDNQPDRENILREIVRILRPGGEVTLLLPETNLGIEIGLEMVMSKEISLTEEGEKAWVVTFKKGKVGNS